MERLVTFIILLLVSLPSYALSITCLKAESEEQRVEWLNESFNNSQIVVQLGQPIPTSSSTTKHKVLRVWKGAVGEFVYVIGGTHSGVLFTSRVNGSGPLESKQSYCRSLSNVSSKASVVDLLKQNHGIGYEPDTTILEPQYPESYLNWLFMFGFVLLVLISMITYSFVKHKTKK